MTVAGPLRAMRPKRRRLLFVVVGMTLLAVAAALALTALQDTILFFLSPSEVQARAMAPGERFRLGGLVVEGSVTRDDAGAVHFVVTDGAQEISAVFAGVLPDLFREGQGVVAEGALTPDGGFRADEVLAKHDENYMPREVADALRENGQWQGEDAQ